MDSSVRLSQVDGAPGLGAERSSWADKVRLDAPASQLAQADDLWLLIQTDLNFKISELCHALVPFWVTKFWMVAAASLEFMCASVRTLTGLDLYPSPLATPHWSCLIPLCVCAWGGGAPVCVHDFSVCKHSVKDVVGSVRQLRLQKVAPSDGGGGGRRHGRDQVVLRNEPRPLPQHVSPTLTTTRESHPYHNT